MTTWFSITAAGTRLSLDADRSATTAFTVANAGTTAVRGDARIVSVPVDAADWFTIDTPSRPFAVDQTDQVLVSVRVPADAPAGPVRFRLRMLLGGGVPEEQFDDGPEVIFDVAPAPTTPTPPPRRPWWIVALVGVILVVVIGIGAFLATRGGPGATPSPSPPGVPDLTVDVRVRGGFPSREAVFFVRNVGTGDVPRSFQVRMETSDGFGGATSYIATLGPLAVGQTETLTQSLGLNENATLLIDTLDEVVESDETNNVGRSG
jgi:hypothetical protein